MSFSNIIINNNIHIYNKQQFSLIKASNPDINVDFNSLRYWVSLKDIETVILCMKQAFNVHSNKLQKNTVAILERQRVGFILSYPAWHFGWCLGATQVCRHVPFNQNAARVCNCFLTLNKYWKHLKQSEFYKFIIKNPSITLKVTISI